MNIPTQLSALKFCRIRKGTKKPFETDWNNKPYSYDEISKYFPQENYGVLCGYSDLVVIDCDNEHFAFMIKNLFPETFTVKTGRDGYHFYYQLNNGDKLEHRIILELNDDSKEHLGEIQTWGQQVVGVYSLHPNGKTYDLYVDMPIAKISLETIQKSLKEFIKQIQVTYEERVYEQKEVSGIDSLSITSIFNTTGMKSNNKGEYFGSHPVHGSTSGMNFWINTNKNVWSCFRCNSGGGVLAAIAVQEGLIDCSDAKSGTIRGSLAKECINIAKHKYGFINDFKPTPLKTQSQPPEKIFNPQYQVKYYLEEQPIHYDENLIWWIWDNEKYKWKVTDEVDILNRVEEITGEDIISPKQRTLILNSLKQECRKTKPKPIKTTWIQFFDEIFDLTTGERFKATPDYFATNPIPYKLHPDNISDTPKMDKMFIDWVGEDYVKTLYEILAYSLLPDYPIHRLFCLIGSGMNGKSCFLRLLKKFVGHENITTTELERLINSRFEVTKLHKKLVCIISETNFTEMKQTSLIKSLSGGDEIGYEYKNKMPFDDTNYAKLVISTNNLPTTIDKTIGWYRRWLIIDFPNQFCECNDIIATIPEEEYESLALKCTALLPELLAKMQFHNEGSIEDRMHKYESKSDFLQHFLDKFIDIEDPNAFISSSEFYKKFRDWSKENRFREMSDTSISEKLKQKGIDKGTTYVDDWHNPDKKTKIRCYFGVRWRS